MTKQLVLFALAVTVAAGCTSRAPVVVRPAEPGVLQREFEQTHARPADADYVVCDDYDENDMGVTEIAMETVFCDLRCSTSTLRLFSDGRAESIGRASAKTGGGRRGRLDRHRFRRLARTAMAIGFFDLKDRYTCMATDNPTVYVAITRGRTRKIIEHYAPEHTGPPTLRLFEDAIEDVEGFVEWEPK